MATTTISESTTTDGQLLAAFVETRDQQPFAQLVARHQGMVLAVCRRLAKHSHDAEDAAQRVFLTLAQKAPSLKRRDSLAGWLFKTARHMGRDARRARARRMHHESKAEQDAPTRHDDQDPQRREWREVLDHQLAGLPSKYREPIVLHHLEGFSHKQAAQHMGLAETTFAMRLSRARELLRSKMVRSGLAFSTSAWAVLEADQDASACEAFSSPGFLHEAVQQLEKNSMVSRFYGLSALVIFTVAVAGTSYAFSKPAGPEDSKPLANADHNPVKEVTKAEIDKQLVGNQEFALKIYQQFREEKKDKNICFSPFSITGAFGMVYAGAKGETAKEIAQTMDYTSAPDRMGWINRSITRDLMRRAEKNKMALNIANAMVQTGPGASDSFKRLVLNQYDGEIISGSDALQTVNDWAKEKTKGKITNVLSQLDPQSVCVLLNAVYFKSTWQQPFKAIRTNKEVFHVNGSKKVRVPMMNQSEQYRVLKNKDVHMLDLPYQGGEMSMTILLPNTPTGLADLEKMLTFKKLNQWTKELDKRGKGKVFVSLPKFKLSSSFDLKPIVIGMGMKRAFGGNADLSGIGLLPGRIYLTQAVQKALVIVNERGTEAAAVTAVEADSKSIPYMFTVDHPFMFVIRDKKTNTILFMGRVLDPTVEE